MKRYLGIIIAAVLLILLLAQSCFFAQEGEYVYITQFGAIVRTIETPGLKFKIPFIQQINYLPKRMRVYDLNSSEVLTQDKKAMVVDSYCLWQIDDATTFVRSIGNLAEMNKRIDASVYSVIKNLMGQMKQDEIISDDEKSRDTLNEKITATVRDQLENYGVAIKAVEIRRFDLPDDNLEAVYQRMISERQQMAETYKADGDYQANIIRNASDREVEVILGEARAKAEKIKGEAEQAYIRALADVYGKADQADFYLFMRELEMLEKSLQGSDKTLLLGKDSPIARMLRGENIRSEDLLESLKSLQGESSR